MAADETARFLASTPDRRRALDALAREPASPAKLAEELSLSRRSVQRHLRAFVDREWARKRDGEYQLTTTGELVADEHATYLDSLDRIDAYGDLFSHLPDAEHAPDPRWLEDATLVTASSENPQAPVRHYLERVRDLGGDEIRMLSPVLSRLYHDAHAELALDGVHTTLVLSESTVAEARTANPIEFRAVLGVGVLDLYAHPGEVAVGLTIAADRVLVCAYGDDGQLEACLDAADDRVLAWANDRFERYREDADRVEPGISSPFRRSENRG